ncbi:MAG: EF-P lysine aminoacylase EpmA [Planctomycetia bacterium]|nr:EF-P lysine aminoacylase EpmA [Planctomycetia bacterium]
MKSSFRPTATLEKLRQRAEILRKIRHFFESRQFLEVETPILSADTVVDRHLDPMTVKLGGKRYFLQTSPEFGMKRFLAAFPDVPIWQMGHVFRKEERGTLHNPEFTMLEYYRPGDDGVRGINFLDEFQQAILARGMASRKTYRQVFEEVLQLNPHTASIAELADVARQRNLTIPEGFEESETGNRDDWLDFLLSETIQPQLGWESPLILYDFPATQAALAITRGDVAERFELYVQGMELANGYHELGDARELRRRNKVANALRRLDGKEILPDESRLLAAMEVGLPACAGTAVGVDRLVMIATGAKTIDEILAFPWERA